MDSDVAFESALSSITARTVRHLHDDFDYRGAVQRGWADAGMDDFLAEEAETAGRILRDEWGIARTYFTGWGIGAETAATEIAERVFGSDAFAGKIGEISEFAIGDLADRFAAGDGSLADPLETCISSYLDANYPAIVQRAAAASIQPAGIDGLAGNVSVDGPRSALDLAAVIAGILLIISGRIIRRISARVAGSVARRVAGKILARAVPVLGWLLLAYEALFATAGAIPSIVDAMHDDKVVTGLQTEIAAELKEGMAENLDEISDGIVADALAHWKAFQENYATLLDLTRSHPEIRGFLDAFDGGADIAPVNRALVRAIEIGGEDTLLRLIAEGRMDEVIALSGDGYRIARQLGDIEIALAWQSFAGERLGDVLRTEVYRLRAPGDISDLALDLLLDLPDRKARTTLAAMEPGLIDGLPRYGADRVNEAGRALAASELASRYFAALADIEAIQVRNRVWARLATTETPDRFVADVEGVAASRDTATAADIVFSDFLGRLDPRLGARAAMGVISGDISWQIARDHYTVPFFIALFVAAILLLWLVRLIFPRRTKVVIRHEK